jgi:hypothetical protein
MRIDHVASNSNEIVFEVRSKTALPPLPLFFTLTPGATVEPASGSLHDFSHGPVTYTVTSEDGEWTRTYRVDFRTASSASSRLFSFEHVAEDTLASGCRYHLFYEVDDEGSPQAIWASGNAGVAILHSDWTPEQFPTYSLDEGQQGRGVCLNTQSTGSLGAAFGKPIAAGNLFLGRFVVENVLITPLKATQFGIPVDREPVRITGYYKYSPGKKFTNKNMKEVPGKTDEASIYAVFYRNKDEQGNSFYLHGDDVLTSPQIVKTARVSSVPPTDQWTPFEMFFEGQDVDKEKLNNNEYNLTIVFSSSKDGDLFEGAIGSTLYIDEVELSFKETEGGDQ